MRVNSQNLFRPIYFCICIMLIMFSVCAYAQNTDVELIKRNAEEGDVSSQYYLGMLYKEGTMIQKDLMLSYVWLSLAAKQKFEDAETQKEKVYAYLPKNFKPTAKVLVDQYYQKHVIPFIPPFEINLNGEKLTKSAEVSPDTPIYAIFKHTDPNVTKVRMHYPKKPSRFKNFEMGRPHRILNHEKFMKAGRKSRSVFTAIGKDGKAYNQIVLTFIPVSEEEVSKEEVSKEEVSEEQVEQKEDENSQ